MNIENFKNFKKQNFPKNLIKEGLIKSYSYERFEKELNKLLNKYDIEPLYEISHLGIFLTFKKDDFKYGFFKDFKMLLNIIGYLISYYYIDDKYIVGVPDEYEIFNEDYEHIEINVIKKFDLQEEYIPEFLYHVTENKYLPKIFKNGLIPKTKNKIEKHPERIYLFNNIKGAKEFKDILKQLYDDKKFTILKIETKLLKSIKLYFDSTFFKDELSYYNYDFKAYYTYDNINSLSIQEV